VEESGADVVAIQEDVRPQRPMRRLSAEHSDAATCRAEPLGGGRYLHNTILVRNGMRSDALPGLRITAGCRVPRCAAAVRLPDHGGLVVANVHLCGGRFDDPHYARLLDVKANQLLRPVVARSCPTHRLPTGARFARATAAVGRIRRSPACGSRHHRW
jgi:hypothetical protein